MEYLHRHIAGIDGSQAQLFGYVIDNSPEIDMDRTRPTVLILPGGGYEMTSDREAEPIALTFVGAGFNAFVLRYSVAPSTYPVALLQAAESMRLMRENCVEWHIDGSHIAVLGFSAGGHLAGNLATSAGDAPLRENGYDPDAIRPNALMLAYPVVSSGRFAHRGSFDALLGKDKDDAGLLRDVSIERHIDEKTPPVFLWHTVTDDCVPVENSILLIQSCKAAGVSIEAHLFPEGGHGLSLGTAETAWGGRGNVVPCVQSWPRLAIDWLNRLDARG
jgi:acetyl esterase/lipase